MYVRLGLTPTVQWSKQTICMVPGIFSGAYEVPRCSHSSQLPFARTKNNTKKKNALRDASLILFKDSVNPGFERRNENEEKKQEGFRTLTDQAFFNPFPDVAAAAEILANQQR